MWLFFESLYVALQALDERHTQTCSTTSVQAERLQRHADHYCTHGNVPLTAQSVPRETIGAI